MKILHYVLAALFFLFAYYQRNDIDPEIYTNPSSLDSALWLLFYAIIGVGFFLMTFKKLPIWYFALAVMACLIEMSMSGPGLWDNLFGDKPFTMTQVSMSAEDSRVELTREFFGALIALAAVLFQFWQNKTHSPTK
ncbi:MAG: membrane-associated phospholipid phosphatase [Akkermansiaceae bacterium]|jgi:membrane-associated phospholipid phosphatase